MWLHFLLLCIWTWKSNGKQNKLYRRPAWDENKIITSKEMANNTTLIWGISVEILTRGKHCNQEPKKMCISSPSDMVKSASFIWILRSKEMLKRQTLQVVVDIFFRHSCAWFALQTTHSVDSVASRFKPTLILVTANGSTWFWFQNICLQLKRSFPWDPTKQRFHLIRS